MLRLFMLLTALVGCNKDPVDGANTPGDGPVDLPTDGHHPDTIDTGTACLRRIVESIPGDNDLGVYYRSLIRVELSSVDPAPSIKVFTDEGDEVAGTTTVDDVRLVWAWDEPLLPRTTYTVVVSHECADELDEERDEFEFTTSVVGEELDVDITGNTYALDVAVGDWVSPRGADLLFAGLLNEVRVLLRVMAPPEPDTIDLLTGIWFDGEQNPCAPTVSVLDVPWTDPYFALPPMYFDLSTATFFLSVEDLVIEGAFAPDGSHIQGAVLAGLLDTTYLGPALLLDDEPDAVCGLLGTLNIDCVACADGWNRCLDLRVENVDAPRAPVALHEVSEDEIVPDCEP